MSNTDEFDDELGNELDSAREHVRDLAESHREDFVNAVCDNITAESGQQQIAEELYSVFSYIPETRIWRSPRLRAVRARI